ncbi:hypothetical protein M2372_002769 [Chryseobacterium sp. BIGb0232]|nr:hypothetical protein [Chryseobacterium sp. BIGb0232]ROS11407.1 hypothetical protein EDF65_3819 [Chryseobacterium nakagawai]
MDEIYNKLVAEGSLYSMNAYLESFFEKVFRSFYNDFSYEEYKNCFKLKPNG